MKPHYFTLSATALAVAVALVACNSGSNGTGSNTTAGSTSTSQGVISGFGSVFVNGIEYEIAGNTSVSVDGADSNESALKVGMLVTVLGTVNADGKTGTAANIKYADQLEGVVSANDIAANGTGSLTVMGQTVDVTAETVFESHVTGVTTPTQIAVGNIVEVSGYASSTGGIVATRVEVKAAAQTAGREIELKGVIANLTATTFTLGSLTVDYSQVATANLPGMALANGQYVEVKSTNAYSGSGVLVASEIELEDNGVKGHQGSDGEEVAVRGMVTADLANNQFEVNGGTVLVTSTTRYEHGSAAQLRTGSKLKVEAHFNSSGALVADKIEFAHTANMELEGTLEAVDVANGTVTVMGKLIHVNALTIMVDKDDAALRSFHLADLSASNSTRVEVSLYQDGTGELIATKLERTRYSTEAKIKGAVTTASGLAVAGIRVDVSQAGTLPSLSDGTAVEVEGTYSSGVLYAVKLEVDG